MKRAAVSGGTGAIGRAVVGRLAEAGYEVFALGRRVERLEALATPGKVHPLAVDLESPAGPASVAATLGGRLDILVLAAGTYEQATFGEGDEGALGRLWSIHVDAVWRLTRALLPALLAARGEVVFVNSSVRPVAGLAPYGAAKAAQRALADGLRAEVNDRGVRVLSVYPGRTAGDLQETLFESEGRVYDASRLLQPDDIARSILAMLELPRTAECTDLHLRPTAP